MMNRVMLELPEQLQFSTDIAVRISDINYGGHLGHDAIISLMHEARVRFLRHHDFSESAIDGVGLIMTDLIVQYKAEVFYGDILTIEVDVQAFNKYGCDFVYRVVNRERGTEVARAKTGIVFFDYAKRRIVGIPQSFQTAFITR
jgi:acyl-CoA thioester hydrolase